MKAPTQTASRLRDLLLDWRAIDGDGGPGTKPDGRGSWHVFCHLAAAGAVFRLPREGAAWVGVIYDRSTARYVAALCCKAGSAFSVHPLGSPAALQMLSESELCGYLEGASRGHILDRSANDPGNPDTDDRRQDYDQNPNSPKDGGPVWEMWTVSRDIRAANMLGTSLVDAYAELLSVLGGEFAAVVARGRMEPEYGHLLQLCALIDAGFVTGEQGLTEIVAVPIPRPAEQLLLEAAPQSFAEAAALLVRERHERCYYMYERKLSSFARASLLRRLVGTFGRAVAEREPPAASRKRRC